MAVSQVQLSGVVFGESPRWHDGRLWFSDWGAREVVTVDIAGHRDLVARMSTFREVIVPQMGADSPASQNDDADSVVGCLLDGPTGMF
jgi:sugar lactone lactonase YvrE